MENSNTSTELRTKATGNWSKPKRWNTGTAKLSFPVADNWEKKVTKVTGHRTKCQALERIITLTDPSMKVNGNAINIMEKVFCPLQMELGTKDNGKITVCKVLVSTLTIWDGNGKESTVKESSKVDPKTRLLRIWSFKVVKMSSKRKWKQLSRN